MENNDTSYYGRILIKALATHYPNNYYILYSPQNAHNKRITSFVNENCVRVKFPRNHINNKERWYTGNGIVKSAKAHGVNTFHGIDEGVPSGFNGNNFPSVFTMTDPLYKSANGWITRMLKQRRARKTCKFVKRIIALNEVDRQIIIDHYHVNPDKVDVVYPCFYNGCDDTVHESMFEILREKYHLPEHFILYKGRFEQDDNIIEAMKLLHELQNRKISIVLVGYRTDYFDKVIKEKAHELHIFHRFKQIDKIHTADLTAVAKMAQAVIIPNTERIRDIYKLINAQRTGTVVICKDSVKAREMGGDAAIYFNNIIEGAELASEVLDNEENRNALIQAGLANSERFTSKQLADEMIHIYRSVLTHRRLYTE